MSTLEWPTAWYASQCDGEWEHQYGVEIGTLDNPGWTVTIELEFTDLYERDFQRVDHNLQSDASWWICWVEDLKWHAARGPRDLEAVLEIFKKWAHSV